MALRREGACSPDSTLVRLLLKVYIACASYRDRPYALIHEDGPLDAYIVFYHVLPNTLQVILAKFILAVAGAMLTEASLSFLGLGDPLQKSWGMMLSYAFSRGGFINGYWRWYLPPGVCICLAALSFVLIGFGLEELDSKRAERQQALGRTFGRQGSNRYEPILNCYLLTVRA